MTASPDNASADSSAQNISRKYMNSIDLSGRLSVQYQQNGTDEAIHGSFNWHQVQDRSMIEILSPLGQILATINVSADGATLIQPGHPAQSAPDVDALTVQTLGWPLPISGLRNWLQGFAKDGANKAFIATPADNQVTTHDGWQISYVTWDDQNVARPHPKRIDLARQTEQAGKVAIRIAIDRWQTP